MKKDVKIIIADDHPIFREGLCKILKQQKWIDVLHVANNGEEALALAVKAEPDVLVLDIQMPRMSGLEVAQQCRLQRLPSKVVLLTMFNDKETFNRALDLGVRGYILKDDASEDILRCVEDVMEGTVFVSSDLTQLLINQRGVAQGLQEEKLGLNVLTVSERKILKLIAADNTSKEIADQLGISSKTVDNHRSNMCRKLGIYGSHSLLRFAFDHRSEL